MSIFPFGPILVNLTLVSDIYPRALDREKHPEKFLNLNSEYPGAIDQDKSSIDVTF